MYQLIPYIERLVALEQRLGDSRLARFSGLGAPRRTGSSTARRSSLGRRAASAPSTTACPANVARLLRDAGVEFGYLYEDDLYAGALAHDLGADEVVAVARAARRSGLPQARRAARDHGRPAHDEHAAHGLPEARRGLRRRGAELPRGARRARAACTAPLRGEVVVHDSCVYARYEDVVSEPRDLLAAAGFTVARAGERGHAAPGAAAGRSRRSIRRWRRRSRASGSGSCARPATNA